VKKYLWLLFGVLLMLTFACQQEESPKTEDQMGLMTAMEKFHTVLRPLQHQAVPNNDVEAIKSQAPHLHNLAEQVANSTVPEDLKEQSDAIHQHQQDLVRRVRELQNQVESGSDEDILNAFSDIHTQYENFADAIYIIKGMDQK